MPIDILCLTLGQASVVRSLPLEQRGVGWGPCSRQGAQGDLRSLYIIIIYKQELVDKLEVMTEESKKQTAANKALESEKAELTSKAEALTEECSKVVATLEGEKEQLTLNIERLTQDCTRETGAKKVLDSPLYRARARAKARGHD